MDLHDSVAKALEENQITMSIASVIATLDIGLQAQFLLYILENNIGHDENEVRKAKKRFLNNTICTIGIEGRKITDFIDILKKNGIEYVLDIRDMDIDIDEPDFTEVILSRELEHEKIHYRQNEDLTIPEYQQVAYEDNGISYSCFEKWYTGQLPDELLIRY